MALAGLKSTAGTTIYIASGEPTDYTAANLALLDWDEIVGVVSFGSWGDQPNPISEPLLSAGRSVPVNGLKNPANPAVSVQKLDTDAGFDTVLAGAGTQTFHTILKKYSDGTGEVATGQLSPLATRDATGNTIAGDTFTFFVGTDVTRLSAADVTTALA
ncbi:hypothetical protein JF540_22970 [Salipiger thiooxidans]|uniref:hypothetical protein n=1 Tax=Salipiger thiooxidans TaxID=282683 RepID=UPI001A8CE9E8|nr:hypothetical protein [Salipiger thiooxidans]MBN8189552.1 hypothetical protein [Salipiger thiooxidans]